jgi:hypothetical protein
MKIAAIARMAALASLTVLATGGAHAVYRCGNVYQDRPCDGGGPQPHLTPGQAAPPATAPKPATQGPSTAAQSPFAAVCSRIGQAAQQMVWKREGGATQQAQMSQLPATGSRDEMIRTLDSVYRKRGSAPEIRALIEAECIAQKQQAADTAAAIKALQAQQPGTNAPSPIPAAAPAAVDAAAGKKSAGETGPSAACPGWRTEMNAINDEFRKGGNAATMERLQTRRREVDKQMLDGRC